MQRPQYRRGFTIHQKVVLEIDFSGALWGYTEITIVPNSRELKTLHLNSRQCTIHSVKVGHHEADFIHNDHLANISVSNPQDCHNHPELKRKIYSALAEGEEGELAIAVPKGVQIKQSGHSTAGDVWSEVGTPEPATPGQPYSQTSVPEFMPIVVTINYSLRNPVDGFQFVLPTEAYPYRAPHAYTTPSSPDAARCWVPCLDSLWEKCTWEFEFIVPRYLEEPDLGANQEDAFHQPELNPTVVVCSGDFIEQVAHPYNSSKSIFLFSQAVLTSVQHIAVAAGPFHVHTVPAGDNSTEDISGATRLPIHAFCLPGHENLLRSSISVLRPATTFFSTEFGSYPFGCYKLVVVDELPTQRFDASTLSLITTDLLHGEDAIEQVLETRQSLSHAIAYQWVGINIQQKTWSDTWLVNGLGLYITGLFLRKLLGVNEYRFRLKRDMQRVVESDTGSMPPICQPQNMEPPDSSVFPFINLKSPLVLHILDRKLGKSGTSLGLSRVLPKVFLSAMSGEMPGNLISTHSFLRTCRKVSGVDLRSFAEQWIYGSGCPAFGFSATFNRKKMAVEITMRQEAPAFKALEHNEVSRALLKPVPFFEGQMTVRIHEADGTPYEHVLDMHTPYKRYEVPFNTKYKRVRRNTKRYLARQAAAQAAAEGDADAVEAMGMVDMGFGLEIWEKVQERENWKVVDWTEEDEQIMSGATYEWIRMDADFEWIANIAFDQPDFMWVSQLQRDRDVVAQLEAVHALSKQPTAVVSSTLTKTVLVSNYYFRIRVEAALALVNCAIKNVNFLGLFHLFKLFLRYCYDPEDSKQDLFNHTYIPKPNDFTDLPEYFVRKALVDAISRVRFDTGHVPAVVRRFLIDQLRYNDNTANPYSDAFYICTIITALAGASVSTAPPEHGELAPIQPPQTNAEDMELVGKAIAEVDRYRAMDRLIPSPHNVVTIAVLEFYLLLNLAGLAPGAPRAFFPLTREGNYTQVRIAAFDCLFLTKWYTPAIMRYVLAVMANDPSRAIRRHVARAACQSLAILVSMGEMKSSAKDTDSLLIEEDGSADKAKEMAKKTESDTVIKVLRKDREIGKNEVFREYMMPIALARDVDHEVRWCIIKLADILVKGVEEAPPKVTIHLPPTPVLEAPPPPPSIPAMKLAPKLKLTSGVSPAGSPIVASPAAPPAVRSKIKVAPVGRMEASAKTPITVTELKAKSTVLAPIQPKGKPKPPKEKQGPPKGQSSGMGTADLKACRSALQKLRTHKLAGVFLQPVDPIRDQAPNYFAIIKIPMDLSTMGVKLEQGLYKDRVGFEADFRLMVNNARTYNAAGSFVYNTANDLEAWFDKQWLKIGKTVDAAVARHTHITPLPLTEEPSEVITSEPPTSNAPSAAPVRPMIKLKLGSRASTNEAPSAAPIKPKGRHIRTDMPPPAPPIPHAVDDGSDDILAEVIAIERKKDSEKRRAPAEPSPAAPPAKRKRSDDDEIDEEFLALATSTKKRPPSPVPVPAPTSPSTNGDGHSRLVLASGGNKPRKEKSTDGSSDPHQDVLALKGKEKAPSKASTPSLSKPKKPSPSLAGPIPISQKKCKDVLKTLLKLPDSLIFSVPVDPIRDGCPTYFDEIKEPMDFSTIDNKLGAGSYTYMEDFARDVELVFSNCRKFNPPGTYPTNCADAVEKVFKKEWSKAMEKKLAWSEKRSLLSLLATVVKEDISWVFREPVDPVALNIPTYYDVIPRKDARDLRTIKQKLESDKYDSVDAFEADIHLMANNAIKFNGEESEVGKIAMVLQARVNQLLEGVKSGNAKKRKDGDKAVAAQPAKKLKLV